MNVAWVLGEMPRLAEVRRALLALLEDSQYSRSVCRALLVLTAFPVDGSKIEQTDAPADLESASGGRQLSTDDERTASRDGPGARNFGGGQF